jgi:hypothetical protein
MSLFGGSMRSRVRREAKLIIFAVFGMAAPLIHNDKEDLHGRIRLVVGRKIITADEPSRAQPAITTPRRRSAEEAHNPT